MQQKKLKSQFDLTIVIPAYKEEKRIGKTLDQLAQFLIIDNYIKKLKVETLIVSADSDDNTHKIVNNKSKKFENFKLLKPGPKVGKGRDVQFAMVRAHGRAIIFMDADLATPLRHLSEFYRTFKRGNEVIIATRNLRKYHPSFYRRALSNTGNLLFKLAGGVWVEDSQCGFKMFSYEAAHICFEKLSIFGWGFDMEILAIAKANKLKVKTLRINDWVAMPDGTFDKGMLKNSVIALKELSYILWNRLNRSYTIKKH